MSDTQDEGQIAEMIALAEEYGEREAPVTLMEWRNLACRATTLLRSHPRTQDDAQGFDAWFADQQFTGLERQSDITRAAWNAARRVSQPTKEQIAALKQSMSSWDLMDYGDEERIRRESWNAALDKVAALCDPAPRQRPREESPK